MLKYHFKHCSKCHSKLLTATSIDYGVCFYCRNYTKIEMKRLIEWNRLYQEQQDKETNSRFERWEKESILLELKLCRNNFIKTGYMTKPNQKFKKMRTDEVAIAIAMRKPQWEEKIIWARMNKGGKGATVLETRKKRSEN